MNFDDFVGLAIASSFFVIPAIVILKSYKRGRSKHAGANEGFDFAFSVARDHKLPQVNVDGTPMSPFGGVDVKGKPLGVRSWHGR